MRFFSCLIIALLFSNLCFSATIHVPKDQPTIQAGISAATTGDTVLVAPGTYVENLDFLGKAILVKSSGGAGATLIDGNQSGSVVVFKSGECADSVLEGFTLTNGLGSGVYPGYSGGGVTCLSASPTITNNIIEQNSSDFGGGGIFCNMSSNPIISNNSISGNEANNWGGGIYCFNSSPEILNNIITGNNAPGASFSYEGGGGICCCYNSMATIANNTITGNSAQSGGGINCDFSSPTIQNNTIDANKSVSTYYYGGGGVYCGSSSAPKLINNSICKNLAKNGAGILCIEFSSPLVGYNEIIGNGADSYGGGIYCFWGSHPTIMNNIIKDNNNTVITTGGGGVYCNQFSSPIIINNLIQGHSVSYSGGGIRCEMHSSPKITNNIIKNNETVWVASPGVSGGGGIFCEKYASPVITNNTIVGNKSGKYGGGLLCEEYAAPEIINTIFWQNTAPIGPELALGWDCTVSIRYSIVKGGKALVSIGPNTTLNWGAGMKDQDPIFVDASNNDFHLTYPSPCRDSGDNSAVQHIHEDNEHDPRVSNGIVDMGADEFHWHLYSTGDKTPGGNVYVKIIGDKLLPAWLYYSFAKLDPPSPSPHGDWYLKWPFMGPFVFTLPLNGVCSIPFSVPNNAPNPMDIYLQSFVGPNFSNLEVMEIR